MTPEQMRAKAADLEAQAEKAFDQKDIERGVRLVGLAIELLGMADAKEALLNTKPAGKVKGMTSLQKAERAKAISRARTKGEKDPLLKAVQDSKWRTLNTYATERLEISGGMLSHYRAGKYDVPARVSDKIWTDFKIRFGRKQ